MASIRMDKQIFPFFDSVKTPITEAGTSESFHNNGFSLLTLEVSGDSVGYVEGCINIIKPNGIAKTDEECEWEKLALINLKNFDVTEKFEEKGHYSIAINGMARVRVVLESVNADSVIVGVAEA